MITVSKFLSKHLRHAPEDLGLTLQPGAGCRWTICLRPATRIGFPITYDELIECVETNDKKRFSFDETQATSFEPTRATASKWTSSLRRRTPPDVLFHGTVERFLASIMAEGLKKGKRHHVHLSKDTETARKVGARRGKPIILQVDAAKMHEQGFKFFLSVNGVWLTDSVPANFLTRM